MEVADDLAAGMLLAVFDGPDVRRDITRICLKAAAASTLRTPASVV
jgi:hypothetical protein